MKNLKSLLLAVLLVGFTSSTVMAEEGKVYAAIDVGQVNATNACEGLPANFSCNPTTSAYRLGVGYQANKSVGVEVAYLNAGKITASGTYLGVPISLDATMAGFHFAAIGALPVANNFALLGKAGIALVTGKTTGTAPGVYVTSDQSNTNVTFGLGARFDASDKISIRMMYEDFGTIKTSSTGSGFKVTFLSAGLQIGF